MSHRAGDRGSGDRAHGQRQPNLGRWEQRIVHRGIHGRFLGSGGAQSVPTASSQHPPIGYHGAMQKLPAFQNEPYTDFSVPANRRAMDEALANVRAQLGCEYDLLIGGERLKTGDLLRSVNPSNPREVVGVHHRATAELARRAVDSAFAYFSEWSAIPAEERIRLLLRASDIIRRRKLEFDAWLVLEAGKTWPEADADVSEAIDFCEYYAREMQRLSGPQPPAVQLPGERGELRYLPLGVGVVIPPWNFPLAIMRSEEHTSELQSLRHLVCRLLLEKKNNIRQRQPLRKVARRRNRVAGVTPPQTHTTPTTTCFISRPQTGVFKNPPPPKSSPWAPPPPGSA